MIVGAAPEGPVEFTRRLENVKIVDAGDAANHQAVRIEFPVFVAV